METLSQEMSEHPLAKLMASTHRPPAGKTTLVRKMEESGRSYITLDDQMVLDAAKSDPAGFIRGLGRAIIDEIQRAPDLLLAIKKTVGENSQRAFNAQGG